LTLIGSTVWNGALLTAGYVLGAQWEKVSDAIGVSSLLLLLVLGAACAGVWLWHRRRARRTG
jgi:membrane protein DedA with SNARE-associated domain